MRLGAANRYLERLRKNYAEALRREADLLDFVAAIGEAVGCTGDDVSRAEISDAIQRLVKHVGPKQPP